MPTFSYSNLKNKHKDCMVYIVGKGPSLERLTADYFKKDWSVIITLNDTIAIVQELGLTIPIYSLQKDGYPEFMIRPRLDIPLILQKDYLSEAYYSNHRERYLVHPIDDLGFDHKEVVAVRMAISIAMFMGCTRLLLLCCDSLIDESELRTFNTKKKVSENTVAGQWYEKSRTYILDDLKGITHEFIVPA